MSDKEQTTKKVAKGRRTASNRKVERKSLIVEEAIVHDDDGENSIPVIDLRTLLPDGFFPKMGKFGIGDGYLPVPYRIINFINDNPSNWYLVFNEYQYFGDSDFFLSIIYYILEDGMVNIQNIQTNDFFRLTIDQTNNKEK